MPPRKKVDIYAAKEPFSAQVDGETVVVAAGELVRAGHSLVSDYPDFFEPVDNVIRFDVEQATAAPGEKRKVAIEKPDSE